MVLRPRLGREKVNQSLLGPGWTRGGGRGTPSPSQVALRVCDCAVIWGPMLRGAALGLMLCCCPEIRNNFSARGPVFLFCTGPCKLRSGSCFSLLWGGGVGWGWGFPREVSRTPDGRVWEEPRACGAPPVPTALSPRGLSACHQPVHWSVTGRQFYQVWGARQEAIDASHLSYCLWTPFSAETCCLHWPDAPFTPVAPERGGCKRCMRQLLVTLMPQNKHVLSPGAYNSGTSSLLMCLWSWEPLHGVAGPGHPGPT